VTIEGGNLLMGAAWAYGVTESDVSGPAWMGENRHDIAAKGTPAPPAQLKLMFRALLAERFGFRCHTETRVIPSYALVASRNGPKLAPGSGESLGFQLKDGTLSFHNLTMADFGQRLPRFFPELGGHPVADRTGLNGTYNVTLRLADSDSEFRSVLRNTGTSELSRILQEQLGLELLKDRTSAATIVIDHIEKVPTAN